MNVEERISELERVQGEIRKQLNRIEKLLRKKLLGTDEPPLDYETTGFISIEDLSLLGASTRFGRDGKEYLWADKTDVSMVLQNAKERDLLEQVRDSLEYYIALAIENGEKYIKSDKKDKLIEILKKKLEECVRFGNDQEGNDNECDL